MTLQEAADLRRRHAGTVWACGTVIALSSMVPLLNLAAPLFGTALMVHLFHRMRIQTRMRAKA
ncbi:MAG TPA: hypothetical protein VGM68_08125, partial [Rhizomicrobium sp.]|jgi:uncharacterized protein involved in cysteine biosynthesis